MTFDRLAAALSNRYRIERELGAGGMATVYLAHDIKHDRKVAVKVLRPELAAVIGAKRFLAEIKTTANLQHPHILALFDSGQVDGTVFYVMPFVEGESLRDRITREKQLPIDDALRIAREVADALQYAHEHAVIHRDIKPENILLHGGHALVADFGIALAASKTGGSRMTETGMSLGTPHYMSPEQAMGERDLDARTDIYALGCVTYEMLVGDPPFTASTAQGIVAKVMTERPSSIIARRDRVPEHVEDAVLTALQKLPADRFATAQAFAEALSPQTRLTGSHRTARIAAPRRTLTVPIALAAGAVLGLVAGALYRSSRHEKTVTTGAIVRVTTDDGLEVQPAISPDGKMMVYAGGTTLHVRLYLRPVDGGHAVPLTKETPEQQEEAQWSPNGTSVLFLARGGVDTVAVGVGGGTAVTLIDSTKGRVNTATWAPDGHQIAYVRNDSLFVYTIANGDTRFLAKQPAKECAWSPDGDLIACTQPRDFARVLLNMGNTGPSAIMVTRASGGASIAVTDSVTLNTSPVWAPDGRRLYFISNRDGQRDIYYTAIGGDGRANGAIQRLTTALNAASISLSRDGHRLAYSVYTPQANLWSLPIVPNVVATSSMATQVTFGHQQVESSTVTSDGKTIYYDSERNGSSDIWRLNVGEREPEAMTTDAADEFGGVLSPDGRRLTFYSYPEGSGHGVIWVKPMVGGGPTQRVNSSESYGLWPEWTPDGTGVTWGCGLRQCVATQDNAGPWHVEKRAEQRWNWSPDGQWSTNQRRGTGDGTVSIYPKAGGPAKMLYVRTAAADPMATGVQWGADSRTLYFRSRDAGGHALFWSLSIDGGSPRLIARLDDLSRQSFRNDFSTDGRHLYFGINDRQSDISVVELIER